MVGTGQRQVIAHGVWTRLLEVDLELLHNFGHNVEFMVLNDQLYRMSPSPNLRGEYWLRPPGGVYTPKWRAPIAGPYRVSASMTLRVASGEGNLLVQPKERS